MSSKKQNNDQEGCYVLPRNLEIADIQTVYQDVTGLMSKTYKKFVFDAGEVALIDTAGVQFLVQLVRTLKATDCEISWINDSIQIYQMAAEIGVDDELEE